ncbi:ferrous iron transport protein B [Thermodesulfobium narugense DSM 14796]|uniref:Ferrous iron transport protein B n=1 Tax=Thermodesulfobium narugense DSM 14796 TaxID=747365 RepID=M1E4I5_9BACT|nr:ferrous iron transport protein B [Thermodesulfobium narugense]AEE14187.1 ferrous iron transport protein B [Thermodesulfobium narugense DSM 14796]
MREFTIALIGNPNVGKSAIFNELTGANAHVGNWPGVTVEKKEGKFVYNDTKINVVDLPGIYSLTASSIDERIARDYIVREKPDLVVCIVDSTNLVRNLYLFVLLKELGAKTLLVLNMIDLVENKIEFDESKLSESLKTRIVKTSATKKIGIDELKKAIYEEFHKDQGEFFVNYGKDIESSIKRIESLLNSTELSYNKRFLAIKLLEQDSVISEELKRLKKENIVESALLEVNKLEGIYSDLETEIIEKRYALIEGVIKSSTKNLVSIEDRLTFSDKVDKIVTNRYLGLPIFAIVMLIVFKATFTLGGFFTGYINQFFDWFGDFLSIYIQNPILQSFIKDGLIGGVGTVVAFLPNILILFLFLSFLEDVGYMARAAFVMDKLMHSIGLPGRAFIPLILGFGCNVPAIMATRTIADERDRILTILINPFMSCTARLPIYVLLTGIFFNNNHPELIIFSLYILGIFVAIFSAKLFRSTIPKLKGKVSFLIMELPVYRMPTFKAVSVHTWERTKEFLKKAGTIILLGVLLVWLLSSLPFGVDYGSEESLVGMLGKFFAPILVPAGFGFWQAAVALIFGLLAKETVVGTMGTLFGGEENLSNSLTQLMTPLSAYTFMVMSLLYIPCLATIGVIYRETNSLKWTAFSILYSLLIGWLTATLIYQMFSLIWK